MAERWRALAACRPGQGVDPAVFYPPLLERGQTWDTAAAKAICATCPVRLPCLAEALDEGEHHGVRGGVNLASARERGAARKAVAAGVMPNPGRCCEECGEVFFGAENQRICDDVCRERRERRRWHDQKAKRKAPESERQVHPGRRLWRARRLTS